MSSCFRNPERKKKVNPRGKRDVQKNTCRRPEMWGRRGSTFAGSKTPVKHLPITVSSLAHSSSLFYLILILCHPSAASLWMSYRSSSVYRADNDDSVCLYLCVFCMIFNLESSFSNTMGFALLWWVRESDICCDERGNLSSFGITEVGEKKKW